MPKAPRRSNTSNETLANAYAAWRDNRYRSIEATAKAHGIRPATLRDRIHGKNCPAIEAHGDEQRISPSGEKALAEHCTFLANAGFPCRIRLIRTLACQVLQEEKPWDRRPLGKNWHKHFLNRQPQLKMVFARSLSLERAIANNHPRAIDHFFREYSRIKADYNVHDNNVWNMDETGFMMGYAFAAKVIAMKGRRITLKTIPGNREWVSSIDAISMEGKVMSEFIIFKGKEVPLQLAQEVREYLPEADIAMSDNGWSNHEKGLAWLQRFELKSRNSSVWSQDAIVGENGSEPRPTGYRILIMDGHSSHVNLDFVRFCESSRIVPICLPSHSTHILQPLDLVIFRRLKQEYSDKVDEYASKGWTGINRGLFIRILSEVRGKVYTEGRIRAAFRAAGLNPYDPEIPKARCKKRPSTPTQGDQQQPLGILSSPMHPPTPRDSRALARFNLTIQDESIDPVSRAIVSGKLLQFTEKLMRANSLLQGQNEDLLQHAEERQRRKASKRTLTSNQDVVLTSERVEELLQIREQTEQRKNDEKERRARIKASQEAIKKQRMEALQRRKTARGNAKEAGIIKKKIKKSQGRLKGLQASSVRLLKRH